MALAIDGVVTAAGVFGGNPANTVVMPGLTTTQAGDIIILTVSNMGAGVASVTGTTLGSFTRIGTSSAATPPVLDTWACFAPVALTGEVVSVVLVNNYDPSLCLFGVSGSNQTSLTGAFEPFIGNELGYGSTTLPQNYTTTNPNTMVIGASMNGFGVVPSSAGSGFAFVSTTTARLSTQYKVLSSTATEAITTNDPGAAASMVGFAVIQRAPGTTWNAADKGSNIGLTGGGLIASATGSGTPSSQYVVATTSKSGSGKWVFEFTGDLRDGSPGYHQYGLVTTGRTSLDGNDTTSVLMYYGGDQYFVRHNGSAGGSWGGNDYPMSANPSCIPDGTDVVQIFLDLDNNKLYVKLNGVTLINSVSYPTRADIAAGTGGVNISSGKTWLPLLVLNSTGGGSVTLNPTPTGLPAGWSAWDAPAGITLTASALTNTAPMLGAPALSINAAGIALDGTAHANFNGSSGTASLTTTQSNDYIIVHVLTNGGPLTSVSGSTLGSFTKIAEARRDVGGNDGFRDELWAKFSAAPLTSQVITVTPTSSAYTTIDACGVSGSGQTSLVWDTNSPVIFEGLKFSGETVSITTVAAKTIVLAYFGLPSDETGSAGTGFTLLPGSGNHYVIGEYAIQTTAQTVNASCNRASRGTIIVAIPEAAPPNLEPLHLHDRVLDYGLDAFLTANKIVVCSDLPTTYTEANSTFKIGEKEFASGGGGASTTWNPADKSSANVALSGGNLVATIGSSTFYEYARTTTAKSSGKWVFEIHCSHDQAVGLTQSGVVPDYGQNGSKEEYCFVPQGSYTLLRYKNSSIGFENTQTTPSSNWYLRWYLDFTAGVQYLEVKIGTGSWTKFFGGDAAAGTGGLALTAGTWFPCVEAYGGGHVTTLNPSPTGLPSGWTAWDGVPYTADLCTGGAPIGNADSVAQEFSKLVDNSNATKWLAFAAATTVTGIFVRNQLSGGAATVVSYQVTSGNDFPARDPVGWVLEGSNNGTTWTTLHTVSGFCWAGRNDVRTFNFSNSTAYAYYRFSPTAIGGDEDGASKFYFQVAELRLWTGTNATGSNVALGGTLTSSGDNGLDPLSNVIDNNDSNKWGSQPANGSGYTVGSAIAWWGGYKFATAKAIDRYTLTSGNDSPERDPQDWLFQYSDDGYNFTTADTRTGEDFPSRDQTKTYQFTSPGAHLYWRAYVTKRGDNATSGLLALDEMEMMEMMEAGGGSVVTAGPQDATPTGRQIVTAAVTGGEVTSNGTPLFWAIVDDANTRLLAAGDMTGSEAVTTADTWTLDSMTINVP